MYGSSTGSVLYRYGTYNLIVTKYYHNSPESSNYKKIATMAGFEPARSKSNGLAIHRLNHSATLSCDDVRGQYKYKLIERDTNFHMI